MGPEQVLEDDDPAQCDEDAEELDQVDRDPGRAVRVLGEDDRVVVLPPGRVEQDGGDHRQQPAADQERSGHGQVPASGLADIEVGSVVDGSTHPDLPFEVRCGPTRACAA
jgi:hypothetical protein